MVQAIENTQTNLNATMLSEDVAKAWRELPKNKPLPDTPEVRELVIDLVLEMYGPALRELEKS